VQPLKCAEEFAGFGHVKSCAIVPYEIDGSFVEKWKQD
jgi:hypothetical protein